MSDVSLDPTEGFALLADDTRWRIVAAIAEAPYDEFEGVLPFSALRERAGVRDSGRFNYHLEKLLGTFVRRADGDDEGDGDARGGYALTYAGTMVYRTVVAGFFPRTGAGEPDPDRPAGDCLDCGARLTATAEENRLSVACPECGRTYNDAEFPPTALGEWDDADLLYAFDQYTRHQLLLLSRGVCIWCGAPMTATVDRDHDSAFTDETGVFVAHECDHCHGYIQTRPGSNVLYHPAVVSFLYERGVDVTERPLWELRFLYDGDRLDVRSEEPWRLVLTVASDGDERRLVLDESADVVDVLD